MATKLNLFHTWQQCSSSLLCLHMCLRAYEREIRNFCSRSKAYLQLATSLKLCSLKPGRDHGCSRARFRWQGKTQADESISELLVCISSVLFCCCQQWHLLYSTSKKELNLVLHLFYLGKLMVLQDEWLPPWWTSFNVMLSVHTHTTVVLEVEQSCLCTNIKHGKINAISSHAWTFEWYTDSLICTLPACWHFIYLCQTVSETRRSSLCPKPSFLRVGPFPLSELI